MVGRVFHGFWTVILICAVVTFFAGAAVMGKVAGNGGNALGQGIKGGFIFVSALGQGFREADAVDAQVKAGEAEKRAKAAEERAKRAEAKAKGQ